MHAYWVLVSVNNGQYSFNYYPSVKQQASPDPCEGADAVPWQPNFAAPVQALASGSQALGICICQVNKAPPGLPAPAPSLQLFGAVAKTVWGPTQCLPNWSGAATVTVDPSQGGQTWAAQVVCATQQPPSGETITRGISLAFQSLDASGLAQNIVCSPDPSGVVPRPNQ